MAKHSTHDSMRAIVGRSEADPTTGCIEFQGSQTRGGYRRVRYRQKWVGAHQAVWDYWNGAPPQGLHVLHTCDNRACCNPLHLYLGTNSQNIRDKVERDRSEKSLNIALASKIKSRLAEGLPQSTIAEEFGICQPTVSKINSGKIWAHAPLTGVQ